MVLLYVYIYMYIIYLYQITIFILVPSMMFEQCVLVLYTWCIGHIAYMSKINTTIQYSIKT